jgi:uncharacterized SAM-binding protein YcdF (DUF218 family)
VAAALFVFVGGFIVFANSISRAAPAVGVQADGIVVLTGGTHRVTEAARLLSEGRGRRLLISGANRAATRRDLLLNSGLSLLQHRRVDIGYEALDTVGNAEETRAWARKHNFSRLIIVTSSYHMPRSLVELGRAMPATVLIAYPVHSRNFHNERWWMHAGTARLIFSEYVKFLPSAARYGMTRLLSWDQRALANGTVLHGQSL